MIKNHNNNNNKEKKVIMLMGLQGAGKTTTIGKLATYYKQRRWNPAVVCADTFRAGAYDQLKQVAAAARVPFYGNRMERDPVQVAQQGVACFKQDPSGSLILVDTSGRHGQATELMEEMKEMVTTIQPDAILLVMDGSIGQSAYYHVSTFVHSNHIHLAGIIITKLDGHGKGGGALAAVAAAQCPILFYGNGEHLQDLQPFIPESFIARLLGETDVAGIRHFIQDKQSMVSAENTIIPSKKGDTFTLTSYQSFLQQQLSMGSMAPLLSMMSSSADPRYKKMQQAMQEKKPEDVFRCHIIILQSCTRQELENVDLLLLAKHHAPQRILRLARGSGHTIDHIKEMLTHYQTISSMMQRMPSALMSQQSSSKIMSSPIQIQQAIQKMMGGGGKHIPNPMLQGLLKNLTK